MRVLTRLPTSHELVRSGLQKKTSTVCASGSMIQYSRTPCCSYKSRLSIRSRRRDPGETTSAARSTAPRICSLMIPSRAFEINTTSGCVTLCGLSTDVYRSSGRLTQLMLPNPNFQCIVETIHNLLMKKRRDRRHNQFSIPKFYGQVRFWQLSLDLIKSPATILPFLWSSRRGPGFGCNHVENQASNPMIVKRLTLKAWAIRGRPAILFNIIATPLICRYPV